MKNTIHDPSYAMGRVTASVSHELQNVLAIIRETAGLMEDFLMMGERCENIEELLSKNLSRIKEQVNRGVGLTHGLNGFAHTADFKLCAIDVRGTLTRLLLLTERITRNKGFAVTIDDGESPALTADPLAFQTLCLLCLDALTQTQAPDQGITVTPAKENGTLSLTFACPDATPDPARSVTSWEHWPLLDQACTDHKVSLLPTDGDQGIKLLFQ